MREAAAGVVLLRHVDARGDEAFHNVKLVAPARELRGRDAALGARVRVDAGPFNKILDDGEVAVARRVVERGPAARRRRVAAPRRVRRRRRVHPPVPDEVPYQSQVAAAGGPVQRVRAVGVDGAQCFIARGGEGREVAGFGRCQRRGDGVC